MDTKILGYLLNEIYLKAELAGDEGLTLAAFGTQAPVESAAKRLHQKNPKHIHRTCRKKENLAGGTMTLMRVPLCSSSMYVHVHTNRDTQ